MYNFSTKLQHKCNREIFFSFLVEKINNNFNNKNDKFFTTNERPNIFVLFLFILLVLSVFTFSLGLLFVTMSYIILILGSEEKISLFRFTIITTLR